MADDYARRGPYLRAQMLALMARPYTAGMIAEPSQAEKEAFADAFVESSRPYHERARPEPQGELF